MIQYFSKQISKKMVTSGTITAEDENVYSYGLELLLSTAVSIIGIIIISLLFSNLYAWVLFLLAFIPQRVTAGGYHANTHAMCAVVFFCVFTICMFALTNMNEQSLLLFSPIASIFSFITILLLSPVEAVNKPLDAARRKDNRNKSLVIGVLNLGLACIVFFFLPNFAKFAAAYYFGVISAAISLVAAIIFIKGERTNEGNV